MGTAFRADCLVAEGTELDPGNHLVGAVAVVKRAHYGKMGFAAVRAWGRVNNKVARMALVYTLFFRNIFKFFVFFCQILLLCAPIHTTTSQESLINF